MGEEEDEEYLEEEEEHISDFYLKTREQFSIFDDDGSGSITSDEFCEELQKVRGYGSLSKAEFGDIVALVDVDGSGAIEFPEFIDLMRIGHSTEPWGALQKACKSLDEDNTGTISLSQLQIAIHNFMQMRGVRKAAPTADTSNRADPKQEYIMSVADVLGVCNVVGLLVPPASSHHSGTDPRDSQQQHRIKYDGFVEMLRIKCKTHSFSELLKEKLAVFVEMPRALQAQTGALPFGSVERRLQDVPQNPAIATLKNSSSALLQKATEQQKDSRTERGNDEQWAKM